MKTQEYKITFKKFIGHVRTVNHHRWLVFKLCCKAGQPWRGLIHDLSKYSPIEFWDSVRYYQGGKKSPILLQKKVEGYSTIWLHHKGRNKHHYEYWYDEFTENKKPVIPYQYIVEMICDKLSACMTYMDKEWTKESELKYWREKEYNNPQINPKIRDLLDDVFVQISEKGINDVINKSNLSTLYEKYIST